MKILVIGYGELAEELAKVSSDFDFVGIKRSGCSELTNVNIVNCDYSLGLPKKVTKDKYDWVIFFPKTSGKSIDDYKKGYLSQMSAINDHFPSAQKIFISSTRVYSGYSNIVVDENTPCKPSDEQGKIIEQYEKEALEHSQNCVIRLGGLITHKSNFVKLVLEKQLFLNNKYINGVFISDVVSLIVKILGEGISHQLINMIMPKFMKYSDFDLAFKGEPTNAAVKSLHYNDAAKFKIKSIEEII